MRLAVQNVGICRSDLHRYRGHRGDVSGSQPGHEFVGIIDAVGDGVALDTGKLAAMEPFTTCGQCFHCRGGNENRCAEIIIFGLTVPGGMAEYISVPSERVFPFPGEVASHVGALCEPFAVSVRGIRLGEVTIGHSVAILGAGTIGLLSIPAAFAAGATEVFITARYPHQAEVARHLGATKVFQSGEELLREVGDARIDIVVETVGGQAETLQEAVEIARAGATIVILGVFDGLVGIPGLQTIRKELRYIGSFGYAQGLRQRDFDVTTQLIHRYQDILEPVVTHRFKLDEADKAYEAASDKSTGSINVLIEP